MKKWKQIIKKGGEDNFRFGLDENTIFCVYRGIVRLQLWRLKCHSVYLPCQVEFRMT